MSNVVVDASAVLAFLFHEPGATVVADDLELGIATISAVNYAEVVSKLMDREMPEEAIQITMDNLDLEIIPYDEDQAMLTGLLRQPSRQHGLSLGDRSCLALGVKTESPVVTADSVWQKIPLDIEIRLIR